MNGLFNNKIAFVAGSNQHIISSLVRSFLLEDATVIVPAKSANEIAGLKKSLAGMNAEKLITLIIDYPDYYNAFNVAETIMEEFGKIDIAVLCFKQPCHNSLITETNIIEWEKMIDENITAYFIGARIVFNCMKNNHQAMFVSICQEDNIYKDVRFHLADLSSLIQKKLALMFYDEFKKQRIRFYHILLIDTENESLKNIIPANKNKIIYTNNLGDYILQLYKGEAENSDDLFHSFLESDATNN